MNLSLPEKISAFLKERRHRMYCDACIQERLGLKWRQQVQLVTATLAVTEGYAREFNRCCICQMDRQVTLAERDPGAAKSTKTANMRAAFGGTAARTARRQNRN